MVARLGTCPGCRTSYAVNGDGLCSGGRSTSSRLPASAIPEAGAPDLPEPSILITRYEVSLLPEGDPNRSRYAINVAYRGDGQWARTRGPRCMNAQGEWSREAVPSGQDDAWLAAHRFTLATAQRLAEQHAPHLTVNDKTALDVYRRTRPGPVSPDSPNTPTRN